MPLIKEEGKVYTQIKECNDSDCKCKTKVVDEELKSFTLSINFEARNITIARNFVKLIEDYTTDVYFITDMKLDLDIDIESNEDYVEEEEEEEEEPKVTEVEVIITSTHGCLTVEDDIDEEYYMNEKEEENRNGQTDDEPRVQGNE